MEVWISLLCLVCALTVVDCNNSTTVATMTTDNSTTESSSAADNSTTESASTVNSTTESASTESSSLCSSSTDCNNSTTVATMTTDNSTTESSSAAESSSLCSSSTVPRKFKVEFVILEVHNDTTLYDSAYQNSSSSQFMSLSTMVCNYTSNINATFNDDLTECNVVNFTEGTNSNIHAELQLVFSPGANVTTGYIGTEIVTEFQRVSDLNIEEGSVNVTETNSTLTCEVGSTEAHTEPSTSTVTVSVGQTQMSINGSTSSNAVESATAAMSTSDGQTPMSTDGATAGTTESSSTAPTVTVSVGQTQMSINGSTSSNAVESATAAMSTSDGQTPMSTDGATAGTTESSSTAPQTGSSITTTPMATAPMATTPTATTPMATASMATAPTATTPMATTPMTMTPMATTPTVTTPQATTNPPVDECAMNTDGCGAHSTCVDTASSFNCVCDSGYEHDDDPRVCIDINECSSSPCDGHANCTNVEGSYTCTCNEGFFGNGQTCSDRDECQNPSLFNCVANSECHNTVGSFECRCVSGYTKVNDGSCVDMDECILSTDNCHANANCTNNDGSYTCACRAGYSGNGVNCVDVNECASAATCPEMNTVCVNIPGSHMCNCLSGYEKNMAGNCVDINECNAAMTVCTANSTCSNSDGSFNCTCDSGFVKNGDACRDIDECALSTDNCDQQCVNTVGGYQCSCITGFTRNETTNKCEADQACSNPNFCGPNAVCYSNSSSDTCACKSGYEAANSTHCRDIDECADNSLNTCTNGTGSCTDIDGGYTCSCISGYELASDQRSCYDIDECSVGTDSCDGNAVCTNVEGSYNCTCNDGYTGNGTVCTNINECSTNPCHANATCADNDGSFTCACSAGFQGNGLSCFDIDECTSKPCHADAVCRNTAGSYQCMCKAGYTGNGASCTDINECNNPSSCAANSNCTNTPGSFYCVCQSGYRGDARVLCSDIDECSENPSSCHVNGECHNTNGSFSCQCRAGFSGDGKTSCTNINECTTSVSEHRHQCDPNANCADTNGSYTCTCNSGFSKVGMGHVMGGCVNIDECATNMFTCDPNARCADTDGSYTCTCVAGYSGDGKTCTEINECTTHTDNCSSIANTRCSNNIGGFDCVCRTNFFLVGGTCQASSSRQLVAVFVQILRISALNNLAVVNTPMNRIGLANDVFDLFNASTFRSDLLGVTVSKMAIHLNGTSVTFLVNLMSSSAVTEAQISQAFTSGLTGSDNNTVAPNSVILTGSTPTVQVPVINPCDEDTDNCFELNYANCVFKSNNMFACENCRTGYAQPTTAGQACTDINECITFFDDRRHNCDPNANCEDTDGSYTCTCNSGFSQVGMGHVGGCVNIDECATNMFTCDSNARCADTDGSYICTCVAGYSGDGKTCTEINECATHTDNCSSIANTRCSNNIGGFDCVCRTNFFLVGETCQASSSRQLVAVFSQILGISALNNLAVVNTPMNRIGLANDVFDLFNASTFRSDLLGVTVSKMAIHLSGTSVTFLVNLMNSSSAVTEAQISQAFTSGLTGSDNNTVAPNSVILTGSKPTVQVPVINPCDEDTDNCFELNYANCVSESNNRFTCENCRTGYAPPGIAGRACTAINPCSNSTVRQECKSRDFTRCVNDGPGLHHCEGCLGGWTLNSDGRCKRYRKFRASFRMTKLGGKVVNFTEALTNKSSEEFKMRATDLCSFLQRSTGAVGCEVISFSAGSIVADFALTYPENATTNATKITQDIESKAAQDGIVIAMGSINTEDVSIFCEQSSCLNDGVCEIVNSNITCNCSGQYTGSECETAITTATATTTSTPGPADPGLTTAQIVGIVLGSVALLLIIIIIIVCLAIKCSKTNKVSSEPDMESAARRPRGKESRGSRSREEGSDDRVQ